MTKIRIIVFALIIMILFGWNVSRTPAQTGTAYDLINAVNQLRAANGLPPYQINSILMSTAQGQSEYQASIGTVTHTGPGGTRPIDRAIAAGFGGGSKVFVSENIAGGFKMSVETAIYTYWQDSLHMSTMLNPNAQYVGAGVAKAGDYVYYTLDVGYITGAPVNTSQPLGTSPSYPTIVPYDPFIKSTPRSDGAIIHIVGYGQTLIIIANTYEVPLQSILELNGFTKDAIIYPGDEIIIQTGKTATPTKIKKPSPTITSSPTISTISPTTPSSPTVTRIQPTAIPLITPRLTATPQTLESKIYIEDKILIIIALALSFIVLIILITWGIIKRPK